MRNAEDRMRCQSTCGQIPPISAQYFDLQAMECGANLTRDYQLAGVRVSVSVCVGGGTHIHTRRVGP